MILRLVANMIGHDKVADYLFDHLPVRVLNTLTALNLGYLTAFDTRLHQIIVPEITVQQILNAMAKVEEQGDNECREQ